MNLFCASLQNELFKLRKRRKYLVFFVIGAAICVASGLKILIANLITEGGVSRAAILGGLTTADLPFFLMIFLPLIAIMASCDLFVGEGADHTIRFSLMRPVGKGKLFFTKAFAAFLLCAMNLAMVFVVTAVTQIAMGGTVRGIGTGFLACLLDLIPLAVLVLFFCMVNQFFRGATLTAVLCIVLYIGLMALGTYVSAAGGLLFTGYLKWHNLWIGTTLPFFAMISRIGILAGCALVFACCGYLLFDRKEV